MLRLILYGVLQLFYGVAYYLCGTITAILYRVQKGTFIAYIAINAIIENNISYKISINYCSIKTQIVIILNKSMSIVISTFSEHTTIFRTLSIDI